MIRARSKIRGQSGGSDLDSHIQPWLVFVGFLDPEGSLSATTVVLVLLLVTPIRKMPKALLIRNGKLRNLAYTFVTSFPTGLPS